MDEFKESRRKFLKNTSLSVLGAGLLGKNSHAMTSTDKKEEPPKKLIYRTLGKTGIRVPVIGMGILAAGSPGLIRAALDAGITHFDSTAFSLLQTRNEKMIGEIMKGRPRDSFIYGTKIHLHQDSQTGLYDEELATEEDFTKKLDAALKGLQMEYVDIVYHHAVARRESAFYEPVMNAMEKAKKAGKARFLGLTTHMNVPEAVQAAADSNFYEVVMASYNPRQHNRLQVKEAIANAAKAGLGVVAIKLIRGDVEEGKPVNPVASIKWVLQDRNVHATIPGFSNFEEMNMDLSVMEDLTLTDAELKDLKEEASHSGLFCQGCGQCLKQCPAELPIPDLMRAYMYMYGYRQPALAHSLLKSLEVQSKDCEDCSNCRVVCLNGWKIQEKICDIVRLKDVPAEFLV